jgi:hypothetical protein
VGRVDEHLAPLWAASMNISPPELVMPKWVALAMMARNSRPTDPGGKLADGQSRRMVSDRPVLL